MRYPHLAAQLYNCPLMISMDGAQIIESVFRAYEEERSDELAAYVRPKRVRLEMLAEAPVRTSEAGYQMTDTGIAVLPIFGKLMHRGSSMDAASGMTGYNRISRQVAAMEADKDVRGIMLELDSPGGQVAGAFDLAKQIHASGKPIYAYANEMAASSAYLLASATRCIFLPDTGMVGSVGVMALHRDESAADARRGHKFTLIASGAQKGERSPHSPLSAEAKARIQAEVDRVNDMFVDTVAEYRGIGPDAVRNTEAGMLTPDQAIDVGMADGTSNFGEALNALADAIETPAATTHFYGHRAAPVAAATSSEGATMANANETAANQAELIAQARASALAEGIAQGKAEAATELGATASASANAAKERIKAINTCDAAKGREQLAAHIAYDTDMTVEQATALLAKAPQEKPAAAANPLAAAMAGVPNPNVGLDSGGDGEETEEAVAARIIAAVPRRKLSAIK